MLSIENRQSEIKNHAAGLFSLGTALDVPARVVNRWMAAVRLCTASSNAPALATAAQRPARFLRVVKAVSIPDDDVLDIDNSAFGACPRREHCLEGSQCAPGTRGYLCKDCTEGYYATSTGTCEVCAPASASQPRGFGGADGGLGACD